MKKNTKYGFICVKKDEKRIIENLQSFLIDKSRTFAKIKNLSMLEKFLPQKYNFFYFNLNKEQSTHMRLWPNEDTEGRFMYEERKDIAWILEVRIVDDSYQAVDGYDQARTEKYINDLLDAVGFEKIILGESDQSVSQSAY